MIDLKKIHIGKLIQQRVSEMKIEMPRICKFLNSSEEEVNKMYSLPNIDSDILLRWSKLLEYDFFRIYTQHLILYAPPSKAVKKIDDQNKSSLPNFRKNIYTKEIIEFVLEAIESGDKTKQQVIDEYKIPKTTLYKWISKYNKTDL